MCVCVSLEGGSESMKYCSFPCAHRGGKGKAFFFLSNHVFI